MALLKFRKQLILILAMMAESALLTMGCGGPVYSGKSTDPAIEKDRKGVSAQTPLRDRLDKFNRVYVCCKAREDYKSSGYRSDFQKTYLIQEGKELVNTMFVPLNDTSKNLIMIKVVGNNTTFSLSMAYMEETAYVKNIVAAMQKNYNISEDSAVAIIATYNGKKLTPCPVLSLRSCKYIAKTLLKSALKEENE